MPLDPIRFGDPLALSLVFKITNKLVPEVQVIYRAGKCRYGAVLY